MISRSPLHGVLGAVAIAGLAACSGRVGSDVGSANGSQQSCGSSCADAATPTADAGASAADAAPAPPPAPPPPPPSSATPIPANVVQQLLASCTASQGPVHAWTTPAEVTQLLQGRWLQCPSATVPMGAMIYQPKGTAGIEFAGGTYYGLVTDAGGNVVRGQGFGLDGTVQYDMSPPYTYLTSNTQSGNLFSPAFEDTPRMMLATIPEIGDALFVGVP